MVPIITVLMPVPRIAIIGRPNVGKSSLLNMLAGDKVSIVDDAPGVTRDRVSVLIDLPSHHEGEPERTVELTDTGGYGVYVAEGERFDDVGADLSKLSKDIEAQIAEAISSADVILFCIDAQAGITPLDEHIARLLREQRLGTRQREGHVVPVHIVATKTDGPRWEAHAFEIAALGFGDPILCSARTNYLRREMREKLFDLLPPAEPGDNDGVLVDLKIAIVGKRNAGKSSLVNALAGEPRVIVSEIAGTTRDAVDVRIQAGDKSVMLIDTAGLRRKKSFTGAIEWYAFDRAKRAIERADVVFMLIDATEPVSQVDQQMAMLIQKSFKPCVIVVNKWDMIAGRKNDKGREISPADYHAYLQKELRGLDFAPIVVISTATGLNLKAPIKVAFDLFEQAGQRVPTGQLNRLLESILAQRGPSSKLGTIARVFYAAQVRTHPPTIAMVVNHPQLFNANYMRYMLGRFRDALPFEEVPIRILVRGRKRGEEMHTTEHLKGRVQREQPLVQHMDSEALTEQDIAEILNEEAGDDAEAYFDEE